MNDLIWFALWAIVAGGVMLSALLAAVAGAVPDPAEADDDRFPWPEEPF